MKTYEFFEDFELCDDWIPLGETSVTKEEIISFARVYDPQPMHLDEEAGAASMLGGLAGSGWHTGALLIRMMVDRLLQDCAYYGSPGVGEVNWLAPLYPDDTLSGRCKIVSARRSQSKPHLGIVGFIVEGLNQNGEVVIRTTPTQFIGVKAELQA